MKLTDVRCDCGAGYTDPCPNEGERCRKDLAVIAAQRKHPTPPPPATAFTDRKRRSDDTAAPKGWTRTHRAR